MGLLMGHSWKSQSTYRIIAPLHQVYVYEGRADPRKLAGNQTDIL